MIAKGIIQNLKNSYATVKFYKDSACASCSACTGENRYGQTISINLKESMNFQIGDEITVEIDDMILLKLSFIVYIFPTIAMILGYLILEFLRFSQGICITGSFLSLIISFVILYFYDKKRVKDIGEDFKIIADM
ncbi:MAG: SoxR reducing system RseC family protein [Fusobacteriaceae bacterium]